jgi:hypothetical protein
MSTRNFGPTFAHDKPLALVMTGTSANDMSEALTSEIVDTGRATLVNVTASWPASTGAEKPTGAVSIQANSTTDTAGNPIAGTWQTIPQCLNADIVAGQPDGSGSAGVLTWRNIPWGDSHMRTIYTPTSGGTGVVLTVSVIGKE